MNVGKRKLGIVISYGFLLVFLWPAADELLINTYQCFNFLSKKVGESYTNFFPFSYIFFSKAENHFAPLIIVLQPLRYEEFFIRLGSAMFTATFIAGYTCKTNVIFGTLKDGSLLITLWERWVYGSTMNSPPFGKIIG